MTSANRPELSDGSPTVGRRGTARALLHVVHRPGRSGGECPRRSRRRENATRATPSTAILRDPLRECKSCARRSMRPRYACSRAGPLHSAHRVDVDGRRRADEARRDDQRPRPCIRRAGIVFARRGAVQLSRDRQIDRDAATQDLRATGARRRRGSDRTQWGVVADTGAGPAAPAAGPAGPSGRLPRRDRRGPRDPSPRRNPKDLLRPNQPRREGRWDQEGRQVPQDPQRRRLRRAGRSPLAGRRPRDGNLACAAGTASKLEVPRGNRVTARLDTTPKGLSVPLSRAGSGHEADPAGEHGKGSDAPRAIGRRPRT